MTLAFALGLAVMVVAHLITQYRLERSHERTQEGLAGLVRAMMERDQQRQEALYKQQKASERTVMASERAVRKMVDRVNALADDTRLVHERVDNHFANPNVKRFLDGE